MPARYKGVSYVIDWLRDNVGHQGDDCLMWPFSRARGYGNLKYDGQITYAHRVMCIFAYGEPPTDQHQAAHSCGQGEHGCVNPKHLSWKTPSENQLDKRVHGTASAGGHYKLTPETVANIRAMKGQKTQDEMARMFGVSRRNIGAVLSGKSWPNGVYEKRGFPPNDPRNPSVKRRLAKYASGQP